MYFNHAARNNFCLKETKNYKTCYTYTPYEWRLLLTVWRKQNKTEIKKTTWCSLFDKKKKIENETEKKTLLQLTTYVMCHKNEQWF